MGFISEFKAFAMRGNVIDLAVGVVIGGAFGKIVSAVVEKVFMPIVGLLTDDGQSFTNASVVIWRDATDSSKFTAIGYGAVIQTVIDFLIVAFFIFLVIKAMNRMNKKQEAAPAPPPEPTNEEKLLGEIRDLLKQRNG